jgi:ABC-type antimicrobial peptide transport system permease subunit
MGKLKLQLRIMILALRKSGFRSLMAVSVVALGIAAMMIMLALSTGAERELQAITERMGKNLFVVGSGRVLARGGQRQGWYTSTKLDLVDVKVLREQVRGIRTIVPILESTLPTKFNGRELTTQIMGVSPEYPELRNYQLDEGRLLDEKDDLAKSRVAVVGSFAAKKMNDGFSMVGETIWISGIPFEVVGQLKEKGVGDGQNEDDMILIPLATAQRRVLNVESLSRLLVQVEDQRQMSDAQSATREVLRTTHNLDDDVKDDFNVLSLVHADQVRKISSGFLQGLAQIFALVTLAIGGAGVLAVTYLNVKDRTPEIGLRMAIGARRRNIANLFVAEACVLSGAGGLAGLLAGALGIAVLTQLTGWKMAVDLRGVAMPLFVSMLLGLVFGVIPAMQAAKVAPVDALRDA